MVERTVQRHGHVRLEEGDDRERGQGGVRHLLDRPVDVGAVEASVEGDHLAVERVEGSQAEVAVLAELPEAHLTVVGAVQQRVDRGGLEHDMRLILGSEVLLAQRLQAKGPYEALVDGHDATLARATALRGAP